MDLFIQNHRLDGAPHLASVIVILFYLSKQNKYWLFQVYTIYSVHITFRLYFVLFRSVGGSPLTLQGITHPSHTHTTVVTKPVYCVRQPIPQFVKNMGRTHRYQTISETKEECEEFLKYFGPIHISIHQRCDKVRKKGHN